MRSRLLISIFLLFITISCVDRIFFDVPVPAAYSISINGFISDRPGPYEVSVLRAFDVQSKDFTRSGISAKSVVLSDNEGNSEVMTQGDPGVYSTSAGGMHGRIGGVYKLRVELLDGRIYESIADTLMDGGLLDSAYYELSNNFTINGVQYLFDIYANASTQTNPRTNHFMWTTRTTYKAKTRPELEPSDPMAGGQCYRDPIENKCNYKDPCSGLKNIGSDFKPDIIRVKECECCFCWYDVYNDVVILNDKIVSTNGTYSAIKVDRVPLTGWLLKYKMRVEVSTRSLSPQAFAFWKGIRDQVTAVSNIFQPITGKIPGNFEQKAGTVEHAEGLFYATAISSKEFYIYPGDVPESIVPTTDFPHSDDFSCLKLAPYATVRKPDFWIE